MSVPKPDQLPAVVLESINEGGDLLDRHLTITRGPDWDRQRLLPSGHGTHVEVEDITTRLIATQDAWIRSIVGNR